MSFLSRKEQYVFTGQGKGPDFGGKNAMTLQEHYSKLVHRKQINIIIIKLMRVPFKLVAKSSGGDRVIKPKHKSLAKV